MFELDAVTITPGINLRIAPPSLKPVARIHSEFAERDAKVCPDGETLFAFWLSVWRLCFR
jgi:hypothetical protein